MRNLLLVFACYTGICAALAQPTASTAQLPTKDARLALCASRIERFLDGSPRSCKVSHAFPVGSISIPPDSDLAFRPNGSLDIARIGTEVSVYGHVLPKGSALFFTPEGTLWQFWLGRDTVLQGHLAGGQDDGRGIRLHPNGKLLAIWLAQDEVIDGVPCTSSGNPLRMGITAARLGTQRMAWFHENGHLQQAMLSEDFTLQGHSFKKGDVISLTPDGQVDVNAKKLL